LTAVPFFGIIFEVSPPWERQEVSMNAEHDWEKLYHTAVLETDWSRMEERIEATESAITGRLHEFSLNHGGTAEENKAIARALDGLEALRKDVTAWQAKRAG
jgi:hypothetical protein